jgi:hypothetical protein
MLASEQHHDAGRLFRQHTTRRLSDYHPQLFQRGAHGFVASAYYKQLRLLRSM